MREPRSLASSNTHFRDNLGRGGPSGRALDKALSYFSTRLEQLLYLLIAKHGVSLQLALAGTKNVVRNHNRVEACIPIPCTGM